LKMAPGTYTQPGEPGLRRAVATPGAGACVVGLGCPMLSDADWPTPWVHAAPVARELPAAGVQTPAPCTHGSSLDSGGRGQNSAFLETDWGIRISGSLKKELRELGPW
jgi:hypothetical protein